MKEYHLGISEMMAEILGWTDIETTKTYMHGDEVRVGFSPSSGRREFKVPIPAYTHDIRYYEEVKQYIAGNGGCGSMRPKGHLIIERFPDGFCKATITDGKKKVYAEAGWTQEQAAVVLAAIAFAQALKESEKQPKKN